MISRTDFESAWLDLTQVAALIEVVGDRLLDGLGQEGGNVTVQHTTPADFMAMQCALSVFKTQFEKFDGVFYQRLREERANA